MSDLVAAGHDPDRHRMLMPLMVAIPERSDRLDALMRWTATGSSTLASGSKRSSQPIDGAALRPATKSAQRGLHLRPLVVASLFRRVTVTATAASPRRPAALRAQAIQNCRVSVCCPARDVEHVLGLFAPLPKWMKHVAPPGPASARFDAWRIDDQVMVHPSGVVDRLTSRRDRFTHNLKARPPKSIGDGVPVLARRNRTPGSPLGASA